MKRVFAAAVMLTACLAPFSSLLLPALANETSSQCDLELNVQTDLEGAIEVEDAVITDIYVSEARGKILDLCVGLYNANLTISEQGEITLLQRLPLADVEYFNSGSRIGKIKSIGAITFDYFTNGVRKGKLKRIGDTRLDYYTNGSRSGKIRRLGDVEFDYYTSGVRKYKIRRISNTEFDYDTQGRIETSGSLHALGIVLVDFLETARLDD